MQKSLWDFILICISESKWEDRRVVQTICTQYGDVACSWGGSRLLGVTVILITFFRCNVTYLT